MRIKPNIISCVSNMDVGLKKFFITMNAYFFKLMIRNLTEECRIYFIIFQKINNKLQIWFSILTDDILVLVL